MNNDEIILADLFLKQITHDQQVNTYPFFKGLIKREDLQTFEEHLFVRLQSIATYEGISVIRKFLSDNFFIIVVNPLIPSDTLTAKGKLAKDKGGIHKYKAWEIQEEKKKKNLLKKKRYYYETIKWAVFFILGIAAGYLITNFLK